MTCSVRNGPSDDRVAPRRGDDASGRAPRAPTRDEERPAVGPAQARHGQHAHDERRGRRASRSPRSACDGMRRDVRRERAPRPGPEVGGRPSARPTAGPGRARRGPSRACRRRSTTRTGSAAMWNQRPTVPSSRAATIPPVSAPPTTASPSSRLPTPGSMIAPGWPAKNVGMEQDVAEPAADDGAGTIPEDDEQEVVGRGAPSSGRRCRRGRGQRRSRPRCRASPSGRRRRRDEGTGRSRRRSRPLTRRAVYGRRPQPWRAATRRPVDAPAAARSRRRTAHEAFSPTLSTGRHLACRARAHRAVPARDRTSAHRSPLCGAGDRRHAGGRAGGPRLGVIEGLGGLRSTADADVRPMGGRAGRPVGCGETWTR